MNSDILSTVGPNEKILRRARAHKIIILILINVNKSNLLLAKTLYSYSSEFTVIND